MVPETLTQQITRVTAELAALRDAKTAQLTGGAEKQTGVFRLKEVDYKTLTEEIGRKETQLAQLEAVQAGRSPLQTGQFRTRGH